MKVSLQGKSNGSLWKEEFIKMLKIDHVDLGERNRSLIDFHNEDKELCNFHLYVLTPNTINFYSIAELIDDSNKSPEKTMYVHYSTDRDKRFNKEQVESLYQITEMVKSNGGRVFFTLNCVATFLNNQEIQ